MLQFCLFEIKYRLRHLSPYVFTFIISVIAVLVVLVTGGAFDNINGVIMGQGDKIFLNSPIMLYNVISNLFIISIFFLASFIVDLFKKDFDFKFFNILFSKPIQKENYILGSFLGAGLLSLGTIFVTVIFYYFTTLLPIIDKEMLTQSQFLWYLYPFMISVIPNIYLVGALFIASVIITKRTSLVFGVGFLLWIIQGIAAFLQYSVKNEILAVLLDPFGDNAMGLATRGWTPDELNTQLPPITGYFLLNRVIWVGFGTIVLYFCIRKFNHEFIFKSRKKLNLDTSIDSQSASLILLGSTYLNTWKTKLYQFISSLCYNCRIILKSPALYIIWVIGFGFMMTYFSQARQIYGTATLPVTYSIVDGIIGSFSMFILLIITYFTGELVWNSRENKFNLIEDALPVNNIISFLAKYLTMCLILAGYLVSMMLIGIVYQIFKGYYLFELGLYFQLLFLVRFPVSLLHLFLAFFLQNFINHKYGAHFAFIISIIAIGYFSTFNIEHPLLQPFYLPGIQYSDMAGFGNNVVARCWHYAYWFFIMLLFTGATVMCWKRGIYTKYGKSYLQILKTKPVMVYNSLLVFFIWCVGWIIFYNTNIINTFRTKNTVEKLYVQYEKDYKHFKYQNQPKIQDVRLEVDIYPEEYRMKISGQYELANVGKTPIDTLFVHWNLEERIQSMISKHGKLVHADDFLGLSIYEFTEPLLPNERFIMAFEFEKKPRNFLFGANGAEVRKNGTFINSQTFPAIGYEDMIEWGSERRRKKLGLEPQDLMPNTNTEWGLARNYVNRDADYVTFSALVSTSLDQIALAPGQLIETFDKDNRRYFHYQTDTPIINFYSFVSARYAILKDNWQDIDLEIYYHPSHDYNIHSMMKSMKESLSYYTKSFGPYQHRVLRIAEFPRYGSFAQAFPALIPFSESVGFIADVKPNTIDYPFYITAHEVSHQWWAHQITGGFTRGGAFLAESLAEYSALMVVNNNYQEKLIREQLDYALRQYLLNRMTEQRKELPLTQVEMTQHYLLYNKGLITMHAISRLIGEDNLNQALAKFVQENKYTFNPYPHTTMFRQNLEPFIPDTLKTTVHEMLNEIVMYDHKIDKVRLEYGDDYDCLISVDFTTEKLVFDTEGKRENLDYQGWLEIGLLDRQKNLISQEKVKVEGKTNHVVLVAQEKPYEVILDPWMLTINRNTTEAKKRVD